MITVLIIEDDPMVAEINRRYLEMINGFQYVDAALHTDEAIAKLHKQPVDLVLLDIYMPEKNGLQLLAEIRAQIQTVDVIVISAANDINTVKSALRLGAVDYLIKPFEFERFNAALRKYQQEHDLLVQEGRLSQKELDALIFHQSAQATNELPKGLTHFTLLRIFEQIKKLGDESFSTEELAAWVGISRVSMRKYLHFLESIGFLNATLNYRSIGRPQYTYRLNPANTAVIQQFLKPKSGQVQQ